MKKLLLSVALGLASVGYADSFNMSVSQTGQVNAGAELKGAFLVAQDNSNNTLRAVKVDTNGNLLTSAGSGGGTQTVTGTVTTLGWIQLTGATYTAGAIKSINLTSTAGYAGGRPLAVQLSSDGAFRWDTSPDSTVPFYFSGSLGSYQAAQTTAIVPLEMSTANNASPFLHLVGASGVSTTVVVKIYRKE
jgi:hypothetical protein